MREAFFTVAARYPADVLKTFIYYKPLYIVSSIRRSMRFNLAGDQSRARDPAGPRVFPYPPLSDRSAVCFACCRAGSFRHWRGVDGGAVAGRERHAFIGGVHVADLFRGLGIAVHRRDLLFYCIFGLGLAAGAMLVAARRPCRLTSMALSCRWRRRSATTLPGNQFTQVPYQGSPQTVTDVIAGRALCTFSPASTVVC